MSGSTSTQTTVLRVKRKIGDEPASSIVLQQVVSQAKKQSLSTLVAATSLSDAAPQSVLPAHQRLFYLAGSFPSSELSESAATKSVLAASQRKRGRDAYAESAAIAEPAAAAAAEAPAADLEATMKPLRFVDIQFPALKRQETLSLKVSQFAGGVTEEDDCYDLYVIDEGASMDDMRDKVTVRFESGDISFLHEYDDESDSAADSEDSNAENNPENDYPSTPEDSSDEQAHERFGDDSDGDGGSDADSDDAAGADPWRHRRGWGGADEFGGGGDSDGSNESGEDVMQSTGLYSADRAQRKAAVAEYAWDEQDLSD